MATLSTALTITSTTTTSDALSISLTDTLTIANPIIDSGRVSVATGAYTEIVDAAVSAITYVYIKNLDATNYVIVYNDAGSPGAFARLHPGEFCIFPVNASTGCSLKANTAACKI